ncbi:MAG: glycosyltransferase family 2 protein [Sulfuricella denitrificans]|nr:glycosyltransferase family 2 protein [Sulfuricella denitrificans]
MQTQPFSVVLITLNAAHQLEACLQSVVFADEIVVVDSGSSDDTPAIALKYGARVVSHPWLGFGPQKQFAVEQARNDWVLCLDADERVSEGLRSSIIAALGQPEFQAYRMPRSNRFMGRYLRHGEGYPDWSLRLFDRRHARWSDDAVHEKVLTGSRIGALRGDLLHDSAEDLGAYLEKQNRYTTLQAATLHQAGHRAHLAQLIFSPAVRFVRFYFFRLGMLDGIAGLVHIAIGCSNSFMKYAKLLALQKGE